MKKAAAETDDDDDLLDMGFWEGRLPMYDMSVCSYELLATTPVFFFLSLGKSTKSRSTLTHRERERAREREDRRRNEEDVPRKKRNETSGIDLFL